MYIYKRTHIAAYKYVCMFMCICLKKLMHDDFVDCLFLYYPFELCSHTYAFLFVVPFSLAGWLNYVASYAEWEAKLKPLSVAQQ